MTDFITKDITFIITTFKSESIIDNCLKALPEDSQKIIVENSSNHNFKTEIEKKYKNLSCYVMDTNLGYGKANNFGIKKSNTPYIFILNPDAQLFSNTIDDMINYLDKIKFAIAAPYSINDFDENFFNGKSIVNQESVKGFAMLLNKKEMNNVGYFDENFFIYLEEIDLCKRAIQNKKNIFLVKAAIDHKSNFSHGNRADVEMEKSRNWHWMWSKFYFNKKHYGYLNAFLKTFPNLISSIIKFIIYSIFKNDKKKTIYLMRFKGLLNSILLLKSDYRPYK